MNKTLEKILLVDDDPFMHTLFKRMLANLGFTDVSSAENGQAALKVLDGAAVSPDLILLDVNMPEMDGIEFVRHLVGRGFVGGLVLVSREDERTLQAVEKLARAHKLNVLGHLQKPVSQERLADLLSERTTPGLVGTTVPRKKYGPGEIRSAIAGGELVVFYQPKVEISTGRVVGVETLVRWLHPRDGMVFPDQFVGTAEKSGLIDDLTMAVLKGALAGAKGFHDAGLKLKVAVNLSMRNLHSLDFPETVEGLAVAAGVPPQFVDLELTESSLMEDVRAPLEILARLRLKRFRLSIDDFGTGNSSLAQLRDLPFDEMKIDQSFTHLAWKDEKLTALFDASLEIGKQLGMSVVAEGVEDKADWDFVRQSGCDIAQGYFMARPMPAADLHGWIRSWQKSVEKLNK